MESELLQQMRTASDMKEVVAWLTENTEIPEAEAKARILAVLSLKQEFSEYYQQIENDEKLYVFWHGKPKQKTDWRLVVIGSVIIIVFLLLEWLFLAANDRFGLGNIAAFFIVVLSLYGIIYETAKRDNMMWFGHIMAILITIGAIWFIYYSFTAD